MPLSNISTKSGFTLVELAIVLMIIGLLIGGVLRGQELINNARITSVIRQVTSYQAASMTFRDSYGGLPGDIINANTRIPNCTMIATCYGTGPGVIGDGLIGPRLTAPSDNSYITDTALDTENRRFWTQLATVKLITGINPTSTSNIAAWGEQFPESKIGGGFHVVQAVFSNPMILTGPILVLREDPGSASASPTLTEARGAAPATARQAAQIDRKMDDGLISAGRVMSISGIATSGCYANDPTTPYDESRELLDCNMMFVLQN